MKRYFPSALLLLLFIPACGKNSVDIEVKNENENYFGTRIVELPAKGILEKVGSKYIYVKNGNGEEIPSQITHDSLLIFPCDLAVGEKMVFQVFPSDTLHRYDCVVFGDFYPKRRDDISYENDRVGFRIYGPGTQAAGERAFGYDLFFKYTTEENIIPGLYGPETDDEVWRRVDSLRRIDKKLAEDYVNSFSYHIDHGKGMDCYAVGSTLGAGVAAILENDTIQYPWCYESAEILDNGPLRFTLALKFEEKGGIRERRIISLDYASHLNSCKVWYEGLDKESVIVAGFPLRDESAPVSDKERGIIAYADPTQGDTNGKALLGIRTGMRVDSIFEKDNHILISSTIKPGESFDYKWGFAWDKTDITTMESWKEYLNKVNLTYTVTIK